MKVYISGVISLGGTLPREAIEKNKAQFYIAETNLINLGHEPVNPLRLKKIENPTWVDNMIEDIKALVDCDAIYMLNNWMTSKGACLEHHIAKELNLIQLYATI